MPLPSFVHLPSNSCLLSSCVLWRVLLCVLFACVVSMFRERSTGTGTRGLFEDTVVTDSSARSVKRSCGVDSVWRRLHVGGHRCVLVFMSVLVWSDLCLCVCLAVELQCAALT